jgi:hypothetical protein
MRERQLSFGRGIHDLVGCTDADGSMAEDWHAVAGYAFLLNGGAMSWACKKQEIVSLSMTESEYITATHAAKEALWLHSLLSQIFGPLCDATTLFSDNQSVITLTQDHQYHAQLKNIDI